MPDLKIKGYSAEFTYADVPKIYVTAPESTEEAPVLVPYTYGEAVSKTVVPDFSGGDMAVPIATGELVTEMTITKPEGLVPENIPEGMYIAGVGPGTYEGGSALYDYTNKYVTDTCKYGYYGLQCLNSITLPKVTTVVSYSVYYCGNLTKIDLAAATSIEMLAFCGCLLVEALIIRTSSMCALESGNVDLLFSTFSKQSLMEQGLGYIYVPSDLVETYKADSVWSYYANNFRAIEDHPDICG